MFLQEHFLAFFVSSGQSCLQNGDVFLQEHSFIPIKLTLVPAKCSWRNTSPDSWFLNRNPSYPGHRKARSVPVGTFCHFDTHHLGGGNHAKWRSVPEGTLWKTLFLITTRMDRGKGGNGTCFPLRCRPRWQSHRIRRRIDCEDGTASHLVTCPVPPMPGRVVGFTAQSGEMGDR